MIEPECINPRQYVIGVVPVNRLLLYPEYKISRESP